MGKNYTFVIKGKGRELIYNKHGELIKERILRPGMFLYRNKEIIHQIHSSPEEKLTTLFIAIPEGNDWGFFTKEGFLNYKSYTAKFKNKIYKKVKN